MKTIADNTGTLMVPDKHPDDIRIALVEDDPMFRHAMEYYLKKIPGNRVFSFSSGEECFRHFHQLDPEILILDYQLDSKEKHEKMTGLDILDEVKAVDSAKEILFVSGQQNFDIATAAIKGGATAYIIKDEQTMNRLIEEVRKIITSVRLKREELRNSKRLLALCVVSAFIFFIAYFSDYSWFTFPMKLLFGITGVAAALLVLSGITSRRAFLDKEMERNSKPDNWLD